MTNPQDNAVTSARFNDNASWDSNQNGLLAGYVGMQKFNGLDMDLDSLNSFFSSHGPIWTALQKNWGGHDYGHVVVICGVSDTGVFVHDPEPMTRGSGKWLTWGQINEAISSFAGGDFQYLTAA